MALFPKLETAIDQGMVLIGETITLVRLGNTLLSALQPTVAELPELVRSTRRLLSELEGRERA